MIDINPDLICGIISKAREFHVKENIDMTEDTSSFSDDYAAQILASHADDLTFQELKLTIDELEPDQQITLVALMWLGRGDYEANEWETALNEASNRRTNYTAEYLLATPLVANYLEEGLNLLGYSCEE